MFAIVIVVVNVRFVSATEIALEPTKIPEGNFSILLYKPVRSELPLRDEFAGFTIVEYSYQSYFPAFDVSYSAGFTDWTPSKEFEINKYGFPFRRSGQLHTGRTSYDRKTLTSECESFGKP